MSPERWQRIDGLFDEALDLPPAERGAFLDRSCAGEPDVREELEALLDACERASDFLGQPPHTLAGEVVGPLFGTAEAETHLAPGQAVGPYRIVEPIGRGGMGVVYLAERADGHFRKRVALKVVKRGMDTDEIVGRFRHERQILARLEHPNVARLLDGGVTEDGRPYFVMECVDGEPLDAYCDRLRLSVRERLKRFMDVLEAVAYAHRNLVVHRDLKPSNILVTQKGEVKLLDFGIAKLLDTDDPAQTVPLTEAHTRRLTPDYAAPEQVRGEPPTTATDVYALGVILYALLAGRRPYDFPTGMLSEIERTICERVPRRPSTALFHPARTSADDASLTPEAIAEQRATLPKKLRRTLAGDLDAIVLKALRKEPERRYASAADLLGDLQRYTKGKTVRARPDTFRYRTSRFVRQHKVGVAATALIMLTLVGGIVATTVQARRAMRAYEGMQVQTERAESQRDFLAGAFASVDPENPTDVFSTLSDTLTKSEFAKALIGGNVARVDELRHPLDQAAVLDVMGNAYLAFGLFAEAESTFTKALGLKRSELGKQHFDLVASLIGIAIAAQNYPDYERATDLYQQAQDILADAAPAERHLLPVIYNNLGSLKLDQRQHDEAKLWFTRALDEVHAQEEQSSDPEQLRLWRARGLTGLGTALLRLGDLDEAEKLMRRALALYERELGSSHPQTAKTLYSLAACLARKGNFADAEAAYHRALVIYRQAYGDDHVTVASSFYDLARLARKDGRQREAERLGLRALAIYEKRVGLEHPRSVNCSLLVGRILCDRDERERAVEHLSRGLSVLQKHGLAEGNPNFIIGKEWLAECSMPQPSLDLTPDDPARL